jgi:hypothetical protein
MIEIKDESSSILKGELHIKMFDRDELIFEGSERNLVVDNSQIIVTGLIASDFANYTISQIGFGDGTTPAISGDAILQGDYTRKKDADIGDNVIFGANIAQVYWNVDYDNDIGGKTFEGGIGGTWTDGDPFTIKEFGLFSTNNNIFNRIVWTGPDLVMDVGIQIEGHFAITVNIT